MQARLHVAAGKLVHRQEINTLSGLIFLQNDKTKQLLVVNNGAVVSILPHHSSAPSSGPELSGADGKAIPFWGSTRHCLTFTLHKFFVNFILAAVLRPILGLNFLAAYRLLGDPVVRLVLDTKTLQPISNVPATTSGGPSRLATALG